MTHDRLAERNEVTERQRGWARGPEVHGVLAYLSRPLYPLLRRVTIRRRGPRRYVPADILLPEGYVAEVVATGLNTPVHCSFGPDGYCYVTECGFKIEAGPPRVLKVDVDTGKFETFFQLPAERWVKTGAFTGGVWHDGFFYFSNTDTLSRVGPDGRIEDVVTDLPGRGDHQTNYPIVPTIG